MDSELRQNGHSRDLDQVDGVDNGDMADQKVAEDAHVLSNLLQSLEASAGEGGPVPNMLKGMETKAK